MTTLRNWRGLILLLGIAAALVTGCGKKPEVVTEAPAPVPQTEIVTEAPAPPPVTKPAEPAPVDYATLDPSAYGIEDVFFPYDVYTLADAGMATLEKNARIMKEHPSVAYLIEGHCDERGTVEYNLALGEKRAKSVQDYLISLGIPAARLRVVSYGEERPYATGHDESAWAQNRRAHFARP